MPQDPQNSKNGDPTQEQLDGRLLKGNINTMRSWAEIDLAALERNLNLIRSALPQPMKYVSVVKADAYGHGILPTAARLMQSGVDLFAVANIKEAAEIREMASGWPILVLGPLLAEEDKALLDYDLTATLSSTNELNRLEKLAKENDRRIPVHLKVDTGMGRLGIWWEEAVELLLDPEVCTYIKAQLSGPFDSLYVQMYMTLLEACAAGVIDTSDGAYLNECVYQLRGGGAAQGEEHGARRQEERAPPHRVAAHRARRGTRL